MLRLALLTLLLLALAALLALRGGAPEAPGAPGGLACYCLENISAREVLSGTWRVAVLEPSETPQGLPERLAARGTLVLAYINIGYAEEWRSYWPRVEAAGIVHGDSGYPGEYLVEYWSPLWRSEMERLAREALEAGYQGVYLDNVDAYLETYGKPWSSGVDPEAEMTRLVCSIAAVARNTSSGARVYVNIGGGTALLYSRELLGCIDGVLREETWTTWSLEPQDPWETISVLDALSYAHWHGKTVIVADPATGPEEAEKLCTRAWSRDWLPVPQPSWDPDYQHPPPSSWCRGG